MYRVEYCYRVSCPQPMTARHCDHMLGLRPVLQKWRADAAHVFAGPYILGLISSWKTDRHEKGLFL